MTKKILVVEDDDLIRKQIVFILQELGNYQAFDSKNGSDALSIAISEIPDLILSDIMMPVMDGYELLNKLRENEFTATIPFIFMSAKVDKSDIRSGMNLGADDYLTKPFDPDELLKAIDTRFSKLENFEKQANSKLEELRTNISFSLPHELLTPLTGIMGFGEMLKNADEEISLDEIKEMGKLIYDSGKRLQHLIENFLLYSRLESTSLSYLDLQLAQNTTIENADLYISTLALDMAEQFNRQEDFEIGLCTMNLHISNDYLSKLFYELIYNSIQFSDTGSKICLNSTRDNMFYKICLSDSGIGMTREQIKSIGAYMQFNRKQLEQQGQGLGLAIAFKIVEIHGGKIEIESDLNIGTKVYIYFPI